MKKTEISNCPVCGSENTQKILSKENYNIFTCSACTLIFTQNLPTDEELNQFYQGFLYRQPKMSEIENLIDKRKKEIETYFKSYLTDKNILFLDYGGGTGSMVVAAKKYGFETHLFDLDKKALEFVHESFKMDKTCLHNDQKILPQYNYDCIFCDNVIEHSKHPKEFLSFLIDLLAPNGTLVIKTPHSSTFQMLFYPSIFLKYVKTSLKNNGLKKTLFNVFFHPWWSVDPPRHLYGFSKRSFQALVEPMKDNIEKYEISYYEAPFFEYTFFPIVFSKPASLKGLLKRMFSLPLVLLELFWKTIHIIFRTFGFLSSMGIVLVIKK